VAASLIAGNASAAAAVAALRTASSAEPVKVPMAASRWTTQGSAEFVQHKALDSLELRNGFAVLNDLVFGNGTIEFDVESTGDMGTGIAFRLRGKDNSEYLYLRPSPKCSEAVDCIQYTPITHSVMLWDLFPRYQGPAPLKEGGWNHVKLVISGKRMNVFINGAQSPTLKIGRLEGDTSEGAIWLIGPGFFANFTVAADMVDELSPEPEKDVTASDLRYLRNWQLSPSSTLAAGKEPAFADLPAPAAAWQPLAAERSGLMNISRVYGYPIPPFKPDRALVWLKTTIKASKSQTKKVDLGWTREAWVFVNGKLVYADKNLYQPPTARKTPDGRCSLENGSFSLPLQAGDNEVVVALANNFYGWAFIFRLNDVDDVQRAPTASQGPSPVEVTGPYFGQKPPGKTPEILAAAALFAGNASGATNEFGLDVLRVSPRVAVVYGDPWNNAILALASSKGLVVVDSSWSKSVALGFRQAIATEFKRSDFVYLINTHEHDDHIGGNAAYADLPIVAHESVRREMLKMPADPKKQAKWRDFSAANEIAKMHDYYSKYYPSFLDTPAYAGTVKCWEAIGRDFHAGPELTPPSITFDRRLTLNLGDLTVRLIYFGGFHSVSETIISVPEENLVMVEQLFFPQRIPIASASQADTTTPAMVDNWLVVLREVLDESDENTRFMACTGRKFMKKGDVEQFLGYLEKMWIGVQRAKAEGKTLDQARVSLPLSDFPFYAQLSNVAYAGTEYELRGIQQNNVDFFWKVLSH
jgi:glyoxylase-like metal-dependent hydrolase (beta-lactamase superfamily II)